VFKKFITFLKNQIGYIGLLFLLYVIPLALFFEYSPYPVPFIQYAVLGVIILFHYVYFNERSFRLKMEFRISKQLLSELKRVPSGKEKLLRANLVVQGRGISVLLALIGVFVVMVYFKKF
jgi:uncharacterized membrane protein